MYLEVKLQFRTFLTSTLDGGEWSASRPGCFTPEVVVPGAYRVGSIKTLPDASEASEISCPRKEPNHDPVVIPFIA